MKSSELMVKLTAAQEKVEKIRKTIENHTKQAEKKLAVIRTNGWDENDRYSRYGKEDHDNAYWAVCEYSHKIEDIENAKRKLVDAMQIAANWEEKLEKQVKLETKYEREMPEIFKQCQIDLASDWTKHDIAQRERMVELRNTLDYKEFRKEYSYSMENNYTKTDDEFEKANMQDAESFIIDLYNRVKAVTGEVTDWANIHYGGKALNGWIAGENGRVNVETILAGGYNIQRLHMRVLVKEFK